MLRMRALFVMAVCLAACVPAQAAEPAGPGPAATSRMQVESLRPQPAAKPSPASNPAAADSADTLARLREAKKRARGD